MPSAYSRSFVPLSPTLSRHPRRMNLGIFTCHKSLVNSLTWPYASDQAERLLTLADTGAYQALTDTALALKLSRGRSPDVHREPGRKPSNACSGGGPGHRHASLAILGRWRPRIASPSARR